MKSIRQQILRALNVCGASTVEELLDQIDGFTRKQVSDNMQAVVQDKLATRRKDASTGMPAYVITDLGVARIKDASEPASDAWNDALTEKMPPSGITINLGDLANDSLRMSLAARDAEIIRLNAELEEYAVIIDSHTAVLAMTVPINEFSEIQNLYAQMLRERDAEITQLREQLAMREPMEFDHYRLSTGEEFAHLETAMNCAIDLGKLITVYGCVTLGRTEQITRWVPHSA